MRIDPDRPSTWKLYREGLCQDCRASCCMLPVEIKIEDLIRLELVTDDEAAGSHKKIAKRLIRDGVVKSYRTSSGLFMLEQNEGRDCYFLDKKTRRCTVYEKRPGVCREFPKTIGPRPGFCPYLAQPSNFPVR